MVNKIHIYYYSDISNKFNVDSTEFIDEFIDLLYNNKADFITETQRKELKLDDNYISNLRKQLSKHESVLPLYDIISNHIFLIKNENIYPSIFYDNYRFVDKNFIDELTKSKNKSDNDLQNIRFMSFYDMDALNKTYMKIFYKSFVFNSYITSCRRPSFASGMEHISPYYNIKELYYLAYDWNLTNKATLEEQEAIEICKQISKFDIPADTLLDHQMYIYDSKAIGLVKHYSLFGSYYINSYLRKYRCCLDGVSNDMVMRNTDLENQIVVMINLIKNAPSFSKPHTVYRFVETDQYMKHLKVGDTYTDPSFMSTTRNPFYYQENYSFGYILIKINLPRDTKGVALCIESYSNFPTEEEIILPPTSKFRLDRIIEGSDKEDYHHILNKKVHKKYEFTLLGNDYIDSNKSVVLSTSNETVIPKKLDMDELINNDNIKYTSISDRLRYFRENYTDFNGQFVCSIGNNDYTFNLQSYDSSNVYSKFFYYKVSDGIMISSSNPKYGNINILLEIDTEIHVNYYFKYSVTDSSHLLDLNRDEWIKWLSMLAYVVGSRTVIIHSNYVINYNKSDTIQQKQSKTRYTFSQNIYQYLKNKKKMFDKFIVEVTPKFDYFKLDYLFGVQIDEIVRSSDKDELYRIYQSSGLKNVGEFYIYIVETYPKFINLLEEKISSIFEDDVNPFKNICYSLDPWNYLYNRSIINSIPSEKEFIIKKGTFKQLIGEKKIRKFKNRLRAYLQK